MTQFSAARPEGSEEQSAPSGYADGTEPVVEEVEEEKSESVLDRAAGAAEDESDSDHWPNSLITVAALAISEALNPSQVTDRAPFLRFLPLMDHYAILHLRYEYQKLVQTGGNGVNVAKHIRHKLGKNPFGDACYATALGRWESEAFWVTAFCEKSETGYTDNNFFLVPLFDRDASDILALKQAFKGERYLDSLDGLIRDKVQHPTHRRAALLAMRGSRNRGGPEQVRQDIEDIKRALGDQKKGATKILSIILGRSRSHLQQIRQGYKDRYVDDLEQEMWGLSDVLAAQIVQYVLSGATDRLLRDASMLCGAVRSRIYNLVTFHLVRFHWDPQYFTAVKAEFRRRYGESVEDAIAEMIQPIDNYWPDLLDWKDFCIQLAMSPDESSQYNNSSNLLHVSNIPPGVQHKEMHDLFQKQPGYRNLYFHDTDGPLTCHVEFEDAHAAGQALHKLTGHRLSTSTKIAIRLNFLKLSTSQKPNAQPRTVVDG
ncbi:hypothetical protein BJY00DRAFT_204488 [Aspergillus carlsbadensis]|nr:hypothetical protein BJY00DRAFT_204488 [Aspergillus carlsbadensis]